MQRFYSSISILALVVGALLLPLLLPAGVARANTYACNSYESILGNPALNAPINIYHSVVVTVGVDDFEYPARMRYTFRVANPTQGGTPVWLRYVDLGNNFGSLVLPDLTAENGVLYATPWFDANTPVPALRFQSVTDGAIPHGVEICIEVEEAPTPTPGPTETPGAHETICPAGTEGVVDGEMVAGWYKYEFGYGVNNDWTTTFSGWVNLNIPSGVTRIKSCIANISRPGSQTYGYFNSWAPNNSNPSADWWGYNGQVTADQAFHTDVDSHTEFWYTFGGDAQPTTIDFEIWYYVATPTATVTSTVAPTSTPGAPGSTPQPTRTPSPTRTPTATRIVVSPVGTSTPTGTLVPTSTLRPTETPRATFVLSATFVIPVLPTFQPAFTPQPTLYPGQVNDVVSTALAGRWPVGPILIISDSWRDLQERLEDVANDDTSCGQKVTLPTYDTNPTGAFDGIVDISAGYCWIIDLTTPLRRILQTASVAFFGWLAYKYITFTLRRLAGTS